MDEATVTASQVISFAQKLEDESAAFYKALAERWREHQDAFEAFAKECQKHKMLVQRTYQETVTDALETGFSFQGLDLHAYATDTVLEDGADFPDAVRAAVRLEDSAVHFYQDVAQRSGSLLATIPRAFSRVAKAREKRKAELEAMLWGTEGESQVT
jgi:rubrerythrin